jgi:hypothetical protein
MLSLFKRVSVFHLIILFVLPLCLVASLHAQSTTGTIAGTVTDIQNAAIPNANITITNTETGIARTITSDAGGRYQVTALIPGVYTIEVKIEGFKTSKLTGITLNVAQVLNENITAQVGGNTETVDVTAETLATQTSTSEVGEVIDNAKVEELPLANRQFYNLVEIVPGVLPPAQASTLGFRGGFNVNGAPETDNQFLVNGTFNNDMGTNQPSFRPSVETIGEFKVLSGVYSADYGRFAGGQIVMITKQGTNRFHGSLYEFLRNGAVEAKPWSPTPQTLTPAFKQNTFGATIGGPMLRDKAFFFFGYEGQRIRQQIVAPSTVPNSYALQGCLPSNAGTLYNPYTGASLGAAVTTGACAGVPGGGFDITKLTDANGVNLWATPSAVLGRQLTSLAYPLPNVAASLNSNLAPSNNYNFSETRQETMNEYNTRGDYKLSEKDSFSGTWNYFSDPSFEPNNSLCSNRTLPNFGCFTNQLSTLANIGETHIFRPTLLNDVRFGFSRLVQPRVQQDNTTIGAAWAPLPGQLGQTAVPNNYGIPSITLTSYTATGGQTNLPQDRWTNHFQFTDAVTWIHGPHSFKFGFDMTDVKSTEYEVTTGRGSLTFSNSAANTNNNSNHKGTTNYALGDMLLGLPSSSSVTPTALPYTYNRFTSFDLFAMDDWKVTPYLTLNLGIRYEIDNPVSEKYGNISTFVPSTQSFLIANQAGVKTLYQTDRNNFAPRVGFAWQPFKNDKTVVKSAFGIFYQEPILYNEFLNYSLQYPVRYPKSFTSGAVNSAGTIAASTTTLTLNNPFNAADVPLAGQVYCPTGSTCNGQLSNIANCGVSLSAPCPLTPVVSGTSIDPKYATPYWDEWSLSIQRQLTRTTLVEVGYYGSKGSRISGNSVLNYNTLGASGAATSALQAQRVWSQWGAISNHKTGFNSEYESLPVRLEERAQSGASILVSYTYGKSLDQTTSAQNPNPNYIDPQTGRPGTQKNDRGLSAFNVKHRLVISSVYPLPFGKGQMWLNKGGVAGAIAGGWRISGIFQYFTGRPFSTTDSSASSGSYNGASSGTNDRPNFTSNPNGADAITSKGTRNYHEWFNIYAFDYSPTATAYNKAATTAAGSRVAGTFGNSAPNTLIGPGWDEIDLTVGRIFSVKEWAKVEFKVDAFNIANHPNYQNPSGSFNGSYTSGGFGTITAANGMRELQGSLHVTF